MFHFRVIESGDLLCLIVITVSTTPSVFTLFGAGRSLVFCPITKSMLTRGDSLHLGGVITSLTGYVSIPTRLCAGRSLRFVLCKLVLESGNLLIGGVITSRAILVSIPTDIFAVGSFCLVLSQIVLESGNLSVGRVVTSRAVLISIPTRLCAGWSALRNRLN